MSCKKLLHNIDCKGTSLSSDRSLLPQFLFFLFISNFRKFFCSNVTLSLSLSLSFPFSLSLFLSLSHFSLSPTLCLLLYTPISFPLFLSLPVLLISAVFLSLFSCLSLSLNLPKCIHRCEGFP